MAPKYSNKLEGKRVLVIGGTSGIGFCVAEACVEFGAIVTVASSRQENIAKTIERLTTSYPDAKVRVSGHIVDLATSDVEGALKTLFEFATMEGKLDHIVNTAGDGSGPTKLTETAPEDIQKYGRVRYVSALMMAKVAPDYMHQTSQSSITITGGVSSTKPAPGWTTIAGWQAAKEGMARGLAVDLKPIRVNLISPGVIDTEILDRWSNGNLATRKQLVELYGSKNLLGKCGAPEDTAEAYLYMMRDTFVTGHVLITDGGYLLI